MTTTADCDYNCMGGWLLTDQDETIDAFDIVLQGRVYVACQCNILKHKSGIYTITRYPEGYQKEGER